MTRTRHSKEDVLGPAIRRRLFAGLVLVAALTFGVGGWAARTPLSGAVIASGVVVVDSNVKKVQHPTGGVVGALLVKNGDRVGLGDVVLRLDDTQTRANLGVVVSQLVQLVGRKARLEAERDLRSKITYPDDFRTSDPTAPAIADGEVRLFELRRDARLGQKKQLTERIGQLEKEIQGLTGQKSSKSVEVGLMREEMGRVNDMRRRELTPIPRVVTTHRDLVRLEGEHDQLTAQIARAGGQISEIRLAILGVDQQMQSETTKELRELEARIAELVERRIAAEDQMKRVDVRAPQDGFVHELAVHTVGGVISPAETLMTIVPSGDSLVIEARVANTDIDQINVGQKAYIRFLASNQRLSPEIAGKVTRIGKDLSKDTQTGFTFFTVRIDIPDDQLPLLGKFSPSPGMPADAFVETEQRTALASFMKPLLDFFNKSLR